MKTLTLLITLAFAGSALAMPPASAPTKAPGSAPATAAGHGVAAPAVPAPDPVKVSAGAIVLLEALSVAVQKNAGDCDAMGLAMLAEINANQDTVTQLKGVVRGGPAGQLFHKQYGERAGKAIKDFLGPLNKCHSNTRVRFALNAL
jgi:hypothetical protein